MRSIRNTVVALLGAGVTVAAIVVPVVPAEASTPIQITYVYYDSPGRDSGTNASLNAEYVRIKNTGTKARSLTGWTLRDAQNHIYKFGTFTLGAGKTVVIHTGRGTNTSTNRYWGSRYYIWNNSGDRATLRTASAVLSDTCAWTALGHGYRSC